jgi:uncharacterized membrane protein YfhO
LEIDLTKQAVSITGGPASLKVSSPGLGDDVEIVVSKPGYLFLRVKNENERFLVFSEIWHPGWRATVDGRDLSLFQTNLALIGAWIEPGKHELVLEFYPPYFKLGLSISACAVVSWLFAFLLWLKRRKRS